MKNIRAKVYVMPAHNHPRCLYQVVHFDGRGRWKASHFFPNHDEAQRQAKNLRKRLQS